MPQSQPAMNLLHCSVCNQMTNHKDGKCLKCKSEVQRFANSLTRSFKGIEDDSMLYSSGAVIGIIKKLTKDWK